MRLAPVALMLIMPLFAAQPDGARWWNHVKYLADDSMQGRETGSPGYMDAARYVAAEFERAGLAPAGTDGYFQPIRFTSRRVLDEGSSVTIQRNGTPETLKIGDDVMISARSAAGSSAPAGMVFAGYGLTIPEIHYDDFAGLDVKGKVVVYLSGAPESVAGPLGSHYQSTTERAATFQKVGAIGTISIANPAHMDIPWSRSSGARFIPAMSVEDPPARLGVILNPASADKLFVGTGHTFNEIVTAANNGKPLPHFAIPGTIQVTAHVEKKQVESPNVIARLTGSDPKLKDEYVVFSAHLDHLGIGSPIHGDSLYNGAMDNAAGIATMLDVAATLREKNAKPKRSILFVAVCGEEKGLLGSRYFALHPTVSAQQIVADINTDMFLPLFPLKSLIVLGAAESTLGDDAATVAKSQGLVLSPDPEPQRNAFIRSDQYSFIRGGIPALALKVGYTKGSPEEEIVKSWLTERYHAPSDDLEQPVDKETAGRFDHYVAALLLHIANDKQRPEWKPDSFFKRFAAKP